MEVHIFVLVLVAAMLHAAWNAFVKVDGDRLLFYAVMLATGGVVALGATLFLAAPDPQSWPYIFLSIVLHQGYSGFLLLAYRYGDLSHVYPLARGSAPLIVALAAWLVAEEKLTSTAWTAVVIIAVGIMSLSLTRGAQGLRDPRSALLALFTGCFIASYTLVDGIGARYAGSAHGYAAWMLGLEWIPVTAFAFYRRRYGLAARLAGVWKRAALVGLMSLAAYWTVIWAMTVAPIALVAALRETSIVFVIVFGVVFLRERLSLARLCATLATMLGAALLKVSRP